MLMEDFDYDCDKYFISIHVKLGFLFDGSSIPRALWSTTGSPFMPQMIGSGLVHDYLYRNAHDSRRESVSKKRADAIYDHCLKLNGVGRYNRWKIRLGLKVGGWSSWRKHRKANK